MGGDPAEFSEGETDHTHGQTQTKQVHDHQGNHGQGTVPLLAIDAWEHAFYLQYENRKAEWVDAFWNVVCWTDVAKRFEAARSIDLVLGD